MRGCPSSHWLSISPLQFTSLVLHCREIPRPRRRWGCSCNPLVSYHALNSYTRYRCNVCFRFPRQKLPILQVVPDWTIVTRSLLRLDRLLSELFIGYSWFYTLRIYWTSHWWWFLQDAQRFLFPITASIASSSSQLS